MGLYCIATITYDSARLKSGSALLISRAKRTTVLQLEQTTFSLNALSYHYLQHGFLTGVEHRPFKAVADATEVITRTFVRNSGENKVRCGF